ncbi:hypothetical protein J6590_070887 [Homalodisca vitripennis]|nr:hypothetical protein J6590_070887 [Homalodisca vitripennis]
MYNRYLEHIKLLQSVTLCDGTRKIGTVASSGVLPGEEQRGCRIHNVYQMYNVQSVMLCDEHVKLELSRVPDSYRVSNNEAAGYRTVTTNE